MPHFEYSKAARLELLDIIEYTRNEWGDMQGRSYLDSLETTFDLLAQYPLMGRPFSTRFRNWRRFEHAATSSSTSPSAGVFASSASSTTAD